MFLGCMTVYQDTDPICVSGGDIPEQLGPEERREGNTDIPGLTQHGGGHPAGGQLATAAGFAHILPKNKHLRTPGATGVSVGVGNAQEFTLRVCVGLWWIQEQVLQSTQGTSGAVQTNTDGFAFSFTANVAMGRAAGQAAASH